MTQSRILLICHAAPFGKAMAAALRKRFGSDFCGALVIDRNPGRRVALQRKISAYLTSTKLERRINRAETTLDKAANRIFDSTAKPSESWPSDLAIYVTANPNDAASLEWLRGVNPDLIMVTGAPILKEDVFDLPRLGTLNMHSSLLPDYRGSHAEFWQVLENRLDTVGLTIHQVEKGVDTGAIIHQVPTSAKAPVSPQMLRAMNLLAALDVVPDAVAQVLDGRAKPKQQNGGGTPRRRNDKTLERRRILLAMLGHPGFGEVE